MTFLTLINIIL